MIEDLARVHSRRKELSAEHNFKKASVQNFGLRILSVGKNDTFPLREEKRSQKFKEKEYVRIVWLILFGVGVLSASLN